VRLFLAACYTSNFGKVGTIYSKLTDGEKYHRDIYKNILESYHYIHKESYVEKIKTDKQTVFLDSGAFSAFTKGVEIDIPEYCDYVKRNKDIIEEVPVDFHGWKGNVQLFSVLDCIGDKEKGAGTLRNQQKMEKLGVFPLPCFHYGEDEKYLEHYIRNYPYITLGGMVPITTKQLYHWLDRMWDKYLTDENGVPKVKVHGFGLTTLELMTRYPWYSVDSSSWVQIAVHGNILIPDGHLDGVQINPNEIHTPGDKILAISSDSPRTKEQWAHYDTLPEQMQQAVLKCINKTGFEVNRLRTSAYSRWAWNFFAFREIEKRVNAHDTIHFKPEQRLLFG
jgi:hypothetical protein